MDSLYEPVPEHQEPKDITTTDSRASTPVSMHVSCGPPDRSTSLVSKISLQSMQCIFQKPITLCADTYVFSWLNCQFKLFRANDLIPVQS